MYKIVVDSCGELPEELKKDGHFETVSLELEVDGYRIKDDETFNQLDFLRRVKKSITGPKSSCPSPEQYMQAYEGEAEHVYVVTLSGKLSGSYNSAELGKNLYAEEHPEEEKQIYVFNSRSASIGETIIGLKIQEYEEAGLSFEEVVARTEEYISSMNTYFVLETLETLRKNPPLEVGGYKVLKVRDYQADTIKDVATGDVAQTGLPTSNVLYYDLTDDAWLCVRPSGTEPKVKFYYGIKGSSLKDADEKSSKLGEEVLSMINTMM